MDSGERVERSLRILLAHRSILRILSSSILLIVKAHDIRRLWPCLHPWIVNLLRLISILLLRLMLWLISGLFDLVGPVHMVLLQHCGLGGSRKKLGGLALIVAWVDGAVVKSSLL